LNQVLSFLANQGPVLLYTLLGIGSALENFFPPVPADTFVLLGAFLAASGHADPWTVFLVTWLANTGAALLVYWAGYRYGRPFFQAGLGRYVLNRGQLERMGRFYRKWGFPAIFFARFLPGLRAMVPVFAGVTHQPVRMVAVPIVVASGIWYGGLVWLGSTAGRNLHAIGQWLTGANRFLLGLAGIVFILSLFWWFRTRKSGPLGEKKKRGGARRSESSLSWIFSRSRGGSRTPPFPPIDGIFGSSSRSWRRTAWRDRTRLPPRISETSYFA
jgi:membrane protein DedA with SNARE-associated domain